VTPERDLGWTLRILLGVIGAGALVASLLVGATELRALYLGSSPLPTLAVALVCGLVAIGGITLLRGAVRGRIVVRRTRFRRRDR
jgi:hypothetical protein